MDTPLRVHIVRLEQRLEALSAEVMANQADQATRNRLEAEIRAANLALDHYRAALEIEKSLISS